MGAAWLAELPGIVEELLECWGCVPDGEVMHGGVVFHPRGPQGLIGISSLQGLVQRETEPAEP